MSFQIHALSPARFAPLFDLTDKELLNAQATRMVVDAKPGYPCRVSLADAEIGETVILVNFQHQTADSPFQAAHAIFVREHVEQTFPETGMVPGFFEGRLISIRAFDDRHFMIAADVIDGSCLHHSIPALLQDTKVAYLHLHNAKQGCFMARVTN